MQSLTVRCLALSLAIVPLALIWVPIQNANEFVQEMGLQSLFSFEWLPEYESFGFGIPLTGSLVLVLCALPFALLIGWGLCLQLVEARKSLLVKVTIPVLETWVSIPSVVIGVWAITQIVPLVRLLEGSGYCLLSAVMGLTVFIVPTTTLLLYRHYQEYRQIYGQMETSLQMSFWQRTWTYVKSCPSAWISTLVYTFCRLFGETMIVLMLSGNSLQIPNGLTDGLRTLTATIALEMSYATDFHELALFTMSVLAIMVVGAAVSVKLGVRHD